jgi:transglutaminase-like putative cysteine protease
MSTVVKPRQLNLDELRRLKWLLGGALALVSLWTVFFLDVEAVGLVGVAGSVILAVLIWPQLPGRVPPLIWKLAVPAIIAAMAADFYFSPDTLPVLIRLAILLVLYRAVVYRRKREDLQLIVLGLFLIVVAGVLTVSLGFAFLLLLFTACALGFLFVINLIAAAETGVVRTPEAETAWTRLGWGNFLARLRAVADWRLMAFAAVLFATVVALSGLLFIFIPRFELATGFFLDKYITRRSRTGFTETVRFGDVSELIRDESVAMRVDLTDSSGLREPPYWRLVVLDEYTPTGFKVSAGLKGELLRSQTVTQRVADRTRGRLLNSVGGVWTFYVEPGVSRFLPLPGRYGILRLRDFLPLQTSASNRLAAMRTEAMTMTAFQLEDVELTPTVADTRFARRLRDARENLTAKVESGRSDPLDNLRGPAGGRNEEVLRRVVAEITTGASLPADEFGRRAMAWLQARHAYALAVKLPAGEGKDDIVRWLDSNEPGFCEYFAAGFTVLARAAGHPARVVAGFHGGVLNGFENYYMVRNSDAHAWAEIYDGTAAWLRVDPTPGAVAATTAGSATAAQQTQDSSWAARLDSLRVLWYRRIVNFDSRTQGQMFDQVKTFTTDSGQALRVRLEEFSRRFKAWLARPWDLARLGRSAVLLAAVMALGWVGWRLGRWSWLRWQVWRRPDSFDPVRREAGRWLVRLREPASGILLSQGFGGPGGQRTGDGDQKTEDRGRKTEDTEVIQDLQRLRYGRRESWPEPRRVFKQAKRARKAARSRG